MGKAKKNGFRVEPVADGYKLTVDRGIENYSLNEILDYPSKYKITEIDFSGCNKLERIEGTSFSDYYDLERVNLSGCTSLEIIKGGAFSGCKKLKDVDLSGDESLEKIWSGVFFCCESLVNVNLSGCKNLTYINEDVFVGCPSLKELNVSDCPNVEIDQYALDDGIKVIREKAVEDEVSFDELESKYGKRPPARTVKVRRAPARELGKDLK